MEEYLVDKSTVARSSRTDSELAGNKAAWKTPTIVILETSSIEGKDATGGETVMNMAGPS